MKTETCPNIKTHYRTEDRARAVLERILKDPDPWRDHNPCRVIPCDRCGDWVLTSTKKNPKPTEPLVKRKPAQRGRRRWSGATNRKKKL